MIRLIASDLDGTLLEADGSLPNGIFDVISELRQLGIHFAASSGRQPGNLMRLFSDASEHMAFVCENGAVNIVDGKDAGIVTFERKVAFEVIHDLEALGMDVLISGCQTCYMVDANRKFTDDIVYRLKNTSTIISSWEQIQEPILKVSGHAETGVADLAPFLLQKWGGRLTATISGKDWFDLTVANKGTGMSILMEYLQVLPQETVAFGDNFNDVSMFDAVGHPFLMESADAKLRKTGIRLCDKVLPVLEKIVNARGDADIAFAKYPQI